MNAQTKIHLTRTMLLIALIAGVILGVVGIAIGIGIPGLFVSVAGWVIVLTALVKIMRRSPTYHARPWRPADRD